MSWKGLRCTYYQRNRVELSITCKGLKSNTVPHMRMQNSEIRMQNGIAAKWRC